MRTSIVLTIILLSAMSLCTGQSYYQGAGRIAISSDGNLRDPDDWGASATMGAILKALGKQSLLVHWDYANSIPNSEPEMLPRLRYVIAETQSKFNVPDIFFDDTEVLDQAIANFKKEADKSTAEDPLFFILAGPMEVPWRMINASNPAIREHIICISHSRANNNNTGNKVNSHEMTHIYTDVQELGVTWVQIQDQNGGNSDTDGFRSQNDFSYWDWMLTGGPDLAWIHEVVLSYTDYKVGYFNDDFDVSDAGMMYYLFTGIEDGNYASLQGMLLGKLGDATCDDGYRNQDETGIDCGGSCAPCEAIIAAGPFAEQDGLVHFPVEAASAVGGWTEETSSFDGFLEEAEEAGVTSQLSIPLKSPL